MGCGIALWRTGSSAKAVKREALAERLRGVDGAWGGDPIAFLHSRGIGTSGLSTRSALSAAEITSATCRWSRESPLPIRAGSPDSVDLCVHSGSRAFGETILREHTERFGAGQLEIRSPEADRYLGRHEHAKRWASANRELLAFRMVERLRTEATAKSDGST
jgi:release factor H-coupled RctB family protein